MPIFSLDVNDSQKAYTTCHAQTGLAARLQGTEVATLKSLRSLLQKASAVTWLLRSESFSNERLEELHKTVKEQVCGNQ